MKEDEMGVRVFNIFVAGLVGTMGVYEAIRGEAVWAAILLGLAIVHIGFAALPPRD